MEVWRNVTIESSLYCANAYVFWCSLFLLFTWSPLTSDLQKMSQTKKNHQYEGAMKLMILVLEDNQLTKQNQKTNRTDYCSQLMCSAVLLMYFLPTYLFYFVQ